MKSILQEANSIERAIDKAWNQAGKPKEFSIKILDEGERNFIGLTRKPAIVTIFYRPEKATAPQQMNEREKQQKAEQRERQEAQRKNAIAERQSQSQNQNMPRRRYAGTEEQRAAFNKPVTADGWQEEWHYFVLNEIRELVRLMGLVAQADAAVTEEKVLTVTFKQALLEDEDEQKMLFVTLAYLGLQLLKRAYKHSFNGFKVMVRGPKADGSSTMSADGDETIPNHEARLPRRRDEGAKHHRDQRGGQGRSGRSGHSSRGRHGGGPDERRDRTERSDRQDRNDRGPRPVSHESVLHKHDAPHTQSADDVAAEQKRFAREQLNREERKPNAPVEQQPGGKKKYPPFFVLEDERSER